MLCVSILPQNIEELYAQFEEAKKHAPLVEIRLDGFAEIPFGFLPSGIGCIFSLKGVFNPELYYTLASLNPEWLDVNTQVSPVVFETLARTFPQVKVIASYHDFEKTPDDLEAIFEKLQKLPCHTIKIATFAHSSLDALRMLIFLKTVSSTCSITALCMGERGAFSRILGPIFGASIIYTCLEGSPVAPGQISCNELKNIYRIDHITQKTVPFGLIGTTIAHSHGHILHNAIYNALGYDAVYVKMFVTPEEFSEAFSFIQQLGFGGLSVTTPLKNSFDPFHAYNTVVFNRESYMLHNTDGKGMIDALERHGSLTGKKVIIIGAGGTARAIAQEAHNKKADVILCNRTFATAEALAQKIGCKAASLDTIEVLLARGYDVLINATTSGLGGVNYLPIKEYWFMSGAIVADVVIEETSFLEMAIKRECIPVSWRDMWIGQAQGQIALWFGKVYDIQTLLGTVQK